MDTQADRIADPSTSPAWTNTMIKQLAPQLLSSV